MVQGAFDDINAAIGRHEITIDDVFDFIIDPTTGNVDYSKFAALLTQIDSEYAATA